MSEPYGVTLVTRPQFVSKVDGSGHACVKCGKDFNDHKSETICPGTTGRLAARTMLTQQVMRAARDLRDASRNCFQDEPEALDAWDALNEAFTALDDFGAETARLMGPVDTGDQNTQ